MNCWKQGAATMYATASVIDRDPTQVDGDSEVIRM